MCFVCLCSFYVLVSFFVSPAVCFVVCCYSAGCVCSVVFIACIMLFRALYSVVGSATFCLGLLYLLSIVLFVFGCVAVCACCSGGVVCCFLR